MALEIIQNVKMRYTYCTPKIYALDYSNTQNQKRDPASQGRETRGSGEFWTTNSRLRARALRSLDESLLELGQLNVGAPGTKLPQRKMLRVFSHGSNFEEERGATEGLERYRCRRLTLAHYKQTSAYARIG